MVNSDVFGGLAARINRIAKTHPDALVIRMRPSTTSYVISYTVDGNAGEEIGRLRKRVTPVDFRSFLTEHIPEDYMLADSTPLDGNQWYFAFVPGSKE